MRHAINTIGALATLSALVLCRVPYAGAAGTEALPVPPTTPAPATTPATAAGTERPVQPNLPLVDKRDELSGITLIDALRQGGYVLYMRHAMQVPPEDKPCTGKDLTPKGEVDAQTVGAAIRDLKIPIGRLLTSEPCRNIDTARTLGLGPHEVTIDLNPGGSPPGFDVGAARSRRLAELPKPNTNTILVSHTHGSRKKSEWMHLETAEVIVYRPDGKGASTPVARIRVEDWAPLLKLANPG